MILYKSYKSPNIKRKNLKEKFGNIWCWLLDLRVFCTNKREMSRLFCGYIEIITSKNVLKKKNWLVINTKCNLLLVL